MKRMIELLCASLIGVLLVDILWMLTNGTDAPFVAGVMGAALIATLAQEVRA